MDVVKPQITIAPANVEMGTGEKLKFKANVENNFVSGTWDLYDLNGTYIESKTY